MDDMDQVLLAMAKRVGDIFQFCGGKDQATCLISVLEPLCACEETVVRTAAAASVEKILKNFEEESNHPTAAAYVSMFKKIAADQESSFYCRVTAAMMIVEVYRVATLEERAIVQDAYFYLCKDDMPIVRRAAANSFSK